VDYIYYKSRFVEILYIYLYNPIFILYAPIKFKLFGYKLKIFIKSSLEVIDLYTIYFKLSISLYKSLNLVLSDIPFSPYDKDIISYIGYRTKG
jgi:hypothetical protein